MISLKNGQSMYSFPVQGVFVVIWCFGIGFLTGYARQYSIKISPRKGHGMAVRSLAIASRLSYVS